MKVKYWIKRKSYSELFHTKPKANKTKTSTKPLGGTCS